MVFIVDVQPLDVNLRLQTIALQDTAAIWTELQVALNFRNLISDRIIDRKHHVQARLISYGIIHTWLIKAGRFNHQGWERLGCEGNSHGVFSREE